MSEILGGSAAMRAKDLFVIRTGLVVIVVAVFLLGAVRFMADQHQCDATNDVRRELIPAAFESYTLRLAQETGADAELVSAVRERHANDLDRLFPELDCSWTGIIRSGGVPDASGTLGDDR